MNYKYFDTIDNEQKAYFLGWIAQKAVSNTNSVVVPFKKKNHYLQSVLAETGVGCVLEKTVTIIETHVRHALAGHTGWFSDRFAMLNKLDETLGWHFLRGAFDSSGKIYSPTKHSVPGCLIPTDSEQSRAHICNFTKIPHSDIILESIKWEGTNALDLMSKLYDNANVYCPYKRLKYESWCCYIPALFNRRHPVNRGFTWCKLHPDAVAPTKKIASDSGYDLTAIREVSKSGKLTMFGTGVSVQGEHGWYFQVIPRSSISKCGYMLANSVGVIDASYRGEIMIPLVKVDDSKPDLTIPAKVVQLIPTPICHVVFHEVTKLDNTFRGEGSFGSTNDLCVT